MSKIKFYDFAESVKITEMHKGPKEFKDFSEKEIKFLKRNIREDSVILDAGCGYGKYIKILSRKARKAIGIDSSALMIEKAEKYLINTKDTEVFLADAEKMPFESNCFDFVICTTNTFGNFLNQRNVLKEMKRVLKPEGKMFFGVFSDKAAALQLEYYRKNNFQISKITKNAIHLFPDLKSERFSKQKLAKIFKSENLDAKIFNLNNISFECIIEKNRGVSYGKE